MSTMHVWQHKASGERWIVELDDDGALVAANGPLAESEIPLALAGDWDNDPEVAADLAETADDFRLWEPPRRR